MRPTVSEPTGSRRPDLRNRQIRRAPSASACALRTRSALHDAVAARGSPPDRPPRPPPAPPRPPMAPEPPFGEPAFEPTPAGVDAEQGRPGDRDTIAALRRE